MQEGKLVEDQSIKSLSMLTLGTLTKSIRLAEQFVNMSMMCQAIQQRGGQTRLTNSADYKRDPERSPDGKYFAYTSGTKEDSDIFVMGFDNSEPVLLFEHEKVYDR